MPFEHIDITTMRGLHLQQNSFTVPAGALEQAMNVVCTNDGVIRKRRGFYKFNTPSATPNSLFFYAGTLMSLMNTKLARLDSAGVATDLSGVAVDVSGITSHSFEANANFYFTSNSGMLKIESPSSAIYAQGVPPALDLTGRLIGPSGSIKSDTQVGYRVVFGRRDSNKNLLLSAPSDILVLVNDPGTSVFAKVQFSIPSEITTTEYFYQLYRTTQSATHLILPTSDFKLVVENKLVAADLTAGFVIYSDSTADLFLGAELYTNQNSQEGELQANDRAPLCKDVCVFKNHAFYANTTSHHRLLLDVVAPTSSLVPNQSTVAIVQSATRTYQARTGVGNALVTGDSASVAGSVVTVNYVAHGLLSGDVIYASSPLGDSGSFTPGLYTIATAAADSFTFAASPISLTNLDFEGVTASGGAHIFQLVYSDIVSAFNPSPVSTSVGLDLTARALVKAINRDTSSVVYARYISGVEDVPGKIALTAKGFGAAFHLTANSLAVGQAFSPELPTSGTTVQSDDDVQPNAIFISKVSEPEAVPLTNFLLVGSRSAKILRIEALRDSIILLKEDGIWRLNGDQISNFVVTALDQTVVIKAENSSVVLNNKVYAMTSAGIVEVTDTSASIDSRQIEIPINAVLGLTTLNAQTHAAAYESERLYIITTVAPNQTLATTTYVFNYITKEWTQWDTLMKSAIVGPNDTLYYTGTDNNIYKERKLQTKVDYCGQDYSLTTLSVSSDKLSVTFSGLSVIPEIGDVVVVNSFINRILLVTVVGSNVTCVFKQPVNFVATNVVTLYSRYTSSVKFAPIHGGSPTRNKHFTTFQAVFRSPSCSRLVISFSNEKFDGSESVEWNSDAATVLGWGLQPWGLFPWGNSELINLDYTTLANLHVRTYVPRFSARGVYLQPSLEHSQAAEEFILQAVGLALRGYSERTVK